MFGRVRWFVLVMIAGGMPVMAQEPGAATLSPEVGALLRYEPTGLSLLRPYERGKIPVVLVHGLWSTPWSWRAMVEALERDPAIRGRFQIWTFGYSTNDPIPYTAHQLRHALDLVREEVDHDRTDAAFDNMVVVGHSMGGLLTKLAVVDSGNQFWQQFAGRPFEDLKGEPEDRDLMRDCLLFHPRPEIRRVVFIATPHSGSHFDRGAIRKVGVRLARVQDPLKAARLRLIEQNGPDFFLGAFRDAVPSSVDELEWGSPILMCLRALAIAPTVTPHSIIAVRPQAPPDKPSDGLVTLESARLDGVASEKIVASGHLCQEHPDVIAEVSRILVEHAGPR